MLTLETLQQGGAFIDSRPVKKPIQWTDDSGNRHAGDVFVIRQPFGAVEQAMSSADKDRSHGARLIALCLRLGEDATEQLSYEQAYNLHPALAWAIVAAINEVHAPKP